MTPPFIHPPFYLSPLLFIPPFIHPPLLRPQDMPHRLIQW